MLVVQQQKPYQQSKIKYLLLVAQLRKTDYDAKITKTEKDFTDHNHDKYITALEFNTLAADVFNARLTQANLVVDFDNSVSSLDNKIAANKTKMSQLRMN